MRNEWRIYTIPCRRKILDNLEKYQKYDFLSTLPTFPIFCCCSETIELYSKIKATNRIRSLWSIWKQPALAPQLEWRFDDDLLLDSTNFLWFYILKHIWLIYQTHLKLVLYSRSWLFKKTPTCAKISLLQHFSNLLHSWITLIHNN